MKFIRKFGCAAPALMLACWVGSEGLAQTANGPGAISLGAVPTTLPTSDAPAASLSAASTVFTTAPFSPELPDAAQAAATAEVKAAVGRDALRIGLASSAVTFLRQALAVPGLTATTSDALNLDLVTACLALDKIEDAQAALEQVKGNTSAAYLLRATMLAARQGRWAEANERMGQVNLPALPADDMPWAFAMKALLAEERKDPAAALAAWDQAHQAAAQPLQQAQLEAAKWRGQILAGEATPQRAELLRQKKEAYKGQPGGVEFALEYAIVLELLGDHQKAQDTVWQLLLTVPDEDRKTKDPMRLLLALLDKQDPAFAARDVSELQKVLNGRGDRHDQEIALALLQSSGHLNREIIDKMLSDRNQPLLDMLMLLQAELALNQGQIEVATASATKLVEQFPSSPLRAAALRLLAFIAWRSDPPRYRMAMDYLNQLRELVPAGVERNRLVGLLADLYFLNGDFRDAAAMYDTVLKAPEPPAPRGALLLRYVQSELSAGGDRLNATIQTLDQAAQLGDIAPIDRWRSEWNVVNALRDHHRDAEAFARLEKMLQPQPGAAPPPAELRLRLRWLAAQLAIDVDDPSAMERAREFQREVAAMPETAAGTPAAAKEEWPANALLLLGKAAYRNPDPKVAKEGQVYFDELRKQYEGSEAAAQSMFYEARELARNHNFDAAQELMNKLAKNKLSPYAPYALFEAAMYAEAREQSNQYAEAVDKLRTLVTNYPDNPVLEYEALMQQGELERKRNNFAVAREIYEYLLRKYPDHPQNAVAEMARADCLLDLAAQSHADPRAREAALTALERLQHLPSQPVEARVEAGVKKGYFLAHGDSEGKFRDPVGAEEAFLSTISEYLLKKGATDTLMRSPHAPWWMARALFELAELYQKLGRSADVPKIYALLVEYKLPGASEAEYYLKNPARGPTDTETEPPGAPAPTAPAAKTAPAPTTVSVSGAGR